VQVPPSYFYNPGNWVVVGRFLKKKRGCKTTAPKNFNHIFIEKPVPKVRVFYIPSKAILVNAIFYLGNASKQKVNV